MKKFAWVCVAMFVVAGCGGSKSAASTKGTRSTIAWSACGNGAECATVQVPLDYANASGEQISVALIRYKAVLKSKRKGTLLLNPGGPGASGVEFLRSTGRNIVSEDVANVFDLVAWDPRGTGDTIPIDCGDRLDYLFDGVNYAPSTPAAVTLLKQRTKQFADACAANSGKTLPFLGSRETIKDMDRIRAALGEKTLNYVGFSYGTFLGALYMQQYPERVGSFVLDGAVDPSLTAEQSGVQQAVGFDNSLKTFLAACGTSVTCGFAGTKPATEAYQALQARVATKPIPAAFGKSVGPAQFDIGVASLLYGGRDAWSVLATTLDSASNGDGSGIYEAFSNYVGRNSDGTYASSYQAFFGIGCMDAPPIGTPDVQLAAARAARTKAPFFGETSLNLNLSCAYWPAPPTLTPAAVSTTAKNPVVIVATTGDPATPLAWGEALGKQLPDARVIVTEGEQHTGYGQGSACVDDAVNAYLLGLGAPNNNTRCAAK
jgi:pimeloyl-ACP methyl ester carboxylesterase